MVLCPAASCSAGQRLGGASFKWAKAQQNAPSRPTHWRRKLGPSLARQIKLGGFGSLSSSRISDVSTSVSGGATASLCAASFDGLGLGLASATVRFAALDTLRALPRLTDLPLGSFPRFCTFDPFLRLAMIAPLVSRNDTTVQVAASYRTRVINRSPRLSATTQALFFSGRTGIALL